MQVLKSFDLDISEEIAKIFHLKSKLKLELVEEFEFQVKHQLKFKFSCKHLKNYEKL